MATSSIERQLKIKMGVCTRLGKEVAAYEKEATTNEAKIQKMRDDGKDVYDIRKQEEVLAESLMMIPDSKGRQKAAAEDLKAFMVTSAEELQASPEFEKAVQLLADAGVPME